MAIERSNLQPDALTVAERLPLREQAGLSDVVDIQAAPGVPTIRPDGQEIQKTRPCVVVSPDELNAHMGTFIVAPLTSGGHRYPFRIPCSFDGKDGHVVTDQLRTVDRERLVKRLGALPEGTLLQVLGVLQEMFAP